jgi:hypothetical protein
MSAALLALSLLPAKGQDAFELPPGVAESNRPRGAPVVSITEETFSLTMEEADRLLHDVPSDVLRYERLRTMVAAGKAQLIRMTVIRTKTGQRTVSESIVEMRFPTEFDPPSPPQAFVDPNLGKPPERPVFTVNIPFDAVTPTAFETRNVGDTLEVEPVLSSDGLTVDLNLVPQNVRYAGERFMNGHPLVKQPTFETSKITTSVEVQNGQPFFLGTMNPKFANLPDRPQKEARVWLEFVTAEVVRQNESNARTKGAMVLVARAQAIRIPKVELREVTVAEAVEFLRKKGAELDPDKKGFNFIVKSSNNPSPNAAQSKFSMSLKDVSLYDTARYVANLAAMVVEPEDSAFLLRPAGENP